MSSGPGQGLNVSCLEEGKQYILTADTQLIDENYGDYACDKYAGWLDPDFCPLFSIRVEEGSHNAKLNLGNDYPEHKVGEENAWNPYQAIFTVDKRLAATKKHIYMYVVHDQMLRSSSIMLQFRNMLEQILDTTFGQVLEPMIQRFLTMKFQKVPPRLKKHLMRLNIFIMAILHMKKLRVQMIHVVNLLKTEMPR